MTKKQIEAIQLLPWEYIQDGTCVEVVRGSGRDWIVAINPALPPIIFGDFEWEPIRFDPNPTITGELGEYPHGHTL